MSLGLSNTTYSAFAEILLHSLPDVNRKESFEEKRDILSYRECPPT